MHWIRVSDDRTSSDVLFAERDELSLGLGGEAPF